MGAARRSSVKSPRYARSTSPSNGAERTCPLPLRVRETDDVAYAELLVQRPHACPGYRPLLF